MISVIIPCYNVEQYIEEAVNCILEGSFQDFEILLIDDYSTDNTFNICKKLSDKDKRICVYQISHSGVGKARNYGIEKAKGEYIAFVDADDLVSKDYLESLYQFMNTNKLDWVVCAYSLKYKNKDKPINIEAVYPSNTLFYGEDIEKKLYKDILCTRRLYNIPSNAMGMYKRDIIINNNLRVPEDIRYGEDFLFNYNYVHHISSFGYLSRHLYCCRVNDNSSTQKMYETDYTDDLIKLFERIEEVRINNNDLLTKQEVTYFMNQCWIYIVNYCFVSDKKERNRRYMSFIERIRSNIYTSKLWDNIRNINVLKRLYTFVLAYFLSKEKFETLYILRKIIKG